MKTHILYSALVLASIIPSGCRPTKQDSSTTPLFSEVTITLSDLAEFLGVDPTAYQWYFRNPVYVHVTTQVTGAEGATGDGTFLSVEKANLVQLKVLHREDPRTEGGAVHHEFHVSLSGRKTDNPSIKRQSDPTSSEGVTYRFIEPRPFRRTSRPGYTRRPNIEESLFNNPQRIYHYSIFEGGYGAATNKTETLKAELQVHIDFSRTPFQ